MKITNVWNIPLVAFSSQGKILSALSQEDQEELGVDTIRGDIPSEEKEDDISPPTDIEIKV